MEQRRFLRRALWEALRPRRFATEAQKTQSQRNEKNGKKTRQEREIFVASGGLRAVGVEEAEECATAGVFGSTGSVGGDTAGICEVFAFG